MTSVFRPLDRPEQVSQAISRQILTALRSGRYPVGSRLPSETELAQQFGVSRPSVREALAALQFAGYVESRRGAGCVVVSRDVRGAAAGAADRPTLRTPGDVVDLLETRLVLEPAAIAAAAADPDPDALDEARAVLDGMRLAAAEPELHAETDVRVHRALARVCRNQVLVASTLQLLDLLLDPVLATTRAEAWSSPARPEQWASHHEAVLEAIAARDALAARRHCLQHLRSVGAQLAATLAGDSVLQARLARLVSAP